MKYAKLLGTGASIVALAGRIAARAGPAGPQGATGDTVVIVPKR